MYLSSSPVCMCSTGPGTQEALKKTSKAFPAGTLSSSVGFPELYHAVDQGFLGLTEEWMQLTCLGPLPSSPPQPAARFTLAGR